jgi:hypothetical protein
MKLFEKRVAAFALTEATVCIAIVSTCLAGIVVGRIQSLDAPSTQPLARALLGLAANQADPFPPARP